MVTNRQTHSQQQNPNSKAEMIHHKRQVVKTPLSKRKPNKKANLELSSQMRIDTFLRRTGKVTSGVGLTASGRGKAITGSGMTQGTGVRQVETDKTQDPTISTSLL